MPRRPNTQCVLCGRSIYRRPWELKAYKRAYCSSACQNKIRVAKTTTKSCAFCGKGFQSPAYVTNRMFCSHACSNKARRGIRYTGDRGKDRANYKARLLVELQRLSGIRHCMVVGCVYARTLDLHRLVRGKDGGTYQVGNTYAICPNHHAEEHRGLIKLVPKSRFELQTVDLGFKSQLGKYLVDDNGEIISYKVLEKTLSIEAEKACKEAIEKLTFSKKSGAAVPDVSTGKITFVVRTQ